MNLKKMCSVAVALLMSFACVPGAKAQTQVFSNQASVPIQMTVGESITLTATGTININPSTGAATSSATLSGSWVVTTGHTSATLYSWFSSSTAALSNGSTNIPSSAFVSNYDGGATVACTQNWTAIDSRAIAGAGCASLALPNPATNMNFTIPNHLFAAWINSGGVATIPGATAGSYTGTVNFSVVIL